MNNTNLMFIALHRDCQKTTPAEETFHIQSFLLEYYIEINKIIAIEPHNGNGGAIINTVSGDIFYCKESASEVIKLIAEAFKNRIESEELRRSLK